MPQIRANCPDLDANRQRWALDTTGPSLPCAAAYGAGAGAAAAGAGVGTAAAGAGAVGCMPPIICIQKLGSNGFMAGAGAAGAGKAAVGAGKAAVGAGKNGIGAICAGAAGAP